MDFESISRRESRKRRRLSERRRLFGNQMGRESQMDGADCQQQSAAASRSESPIGGDQQRISMKIQFHITVAPDNEPLILEALQLGQDLPSAGHSRAQSDQQPPPTPSIGDQIQEKLRLSRQNSASGKLATNGSTKSRQQRLLAMHNSANTTASTSGCIEGSTEAAADHRDLDLDLDHDHDSPPSQSLDEAGVPFASTLPPIGSGQVRELAARSSTITGGMADEDTVKFLQRAATQQQQQRPPLKLGQQYASAGSLASANTRLVGERIYFKRDGQRFGHEFTLKLAVNRTYRCLLKVRPLIPIQSISIHGHQLTFIDCSQQQQASARTGGSAPGSTSSSTVNLSQRLRSGSTGLAGAVPSRHLSQPLNDAYLNKHHHQPRSQHQHHHHQQQPQQNNHNHELPTNSKHQPRSHQATGDTCQPAATARRPGLYHASTTGSLYRASLTDPMAATKFQLHMGESSGSLYHQQQSQMMRHFAASYCSSSNSHLGNQLIYMFDWPAGRFEANKNKNRTQLQTVLKFKNGQILSLPLQVKFYQSECRQHLEWGSQLHFIDYDCQINQLGQIRVERVQYY